MSDIHHIGIVRSYELNCHDGYWYYTMEYVNGYNFSALLDRKQHLSEADCLLICESIAVALAYAWNDFGIVHCDIKPDNIMINTDGVVKLTDLGLCHTFQYIKDGMRDIPDHVMGTPAYISPEQVYGDVEPDCRADIYALAATLYHLATGRMLFPGLSAEDMMRAHCDESCQARDPRFYRPDLSEGFCQLLEAMLVKNRDYRLPSWNDVCTMCLGIEQGVAFKPRKGTPSSLQLASASTVPDFRSPSRRSSTSSPDAARRSANRRYRSTPKAERRYSRSTRPSTPASRCTAPPSGKCGGADAPRKAAGATSGQQKRRRTVRPVKAAFFFSRDWWRRRDSNSRPPRCERDALPTELLPHSWKTVDSISYPADARKGAN